MRALVQSSSKKLAAVAFALVLRLWYILTDHSKDLHGTDNFMTVAQAASPVL